MHEAIKRDKESRPRRFRRYAEYKDSGIEWLGKIPAHWSAKRMKFVVPARISKLETKPANVVYVGLEHIESWTGRLLLETQPESVDSVVSSFARGDVLFGKLRPYLAKAARPDFDGVCTSEILPLRPIPGCFQSYMMFCLLNAPYIHWLDSMTYGTKMPRVSPEQVGSSRAPLPPESEQRAIAAFLDRETAKIDGLVAKKERLIELLQEKRAALITRAVTRGLDSSVSMKDSGVEWLGEIPAHWEVKRLKYQTPGATVGIVVNPSKYYVDEGVPCLRSLNVSSGSINMENLVYISENANELHRKSKIFAGDVVVVRTGQAGTAAVVPKELDGANCIDLLIVRSSEELLSRFVYYYLNSGTATSQAEVLSVGAIQAHYNTSTLAQLVIPKIPTDDQNRIVIHLDAKTGKIDQLIAKIRQAIDHLKEFRTAVISAAVTGKIDVREEAS